MKSNRLATKRVLKDTALLLIAGAAAIAAAFLSQTLATTLTQDAPQSMATFLAFVR